MQLITLSKNDLKQIIQESVRVELEIFKRKISRKRWESDILTRKEVAILLQIDLATVHRWTADETLKAYKIATRVYYKKSDIENLFTSN